MAQAKQVSFLDEECVTLVVPKHGTCKAGFLYWPCFCIKLLVLWDAHMDTLVAAAAKLQPEHIEYAGDDGGYACLWDLEDDDTVGVKDYVSVWDKKYTHVMACSRRPASDIDGVRATITHEGMHVTFAAFRNRGIKLSSDSEEAYTYQTESIVFRTLTLMRTKPKRRIRL